MPKVKLEDTDDSPQDEKRLKTESAPSEEYEGFDIVCQGGTVFEVNPSCSADLASQSSYIKTFLEELSANEGRPRVMKKEHWTYGFVWELMQACLVGYFRANCIPEYKEVVLAAKEIGIDLGICDMVEFTLASPTKENRFLELLSAPCRTTLSLKISRLEWHTLLERGILLLPEYKAHYIVMKPGTDHKAFGEMFFGQKRKTRKKKYDISSNFSVSEITDIIREVQEGVQIKQESTPNSEETGN